MATPRERRDRRKPTAAQAALAAAKRRREEEAKAKANTSKQPEMKPSTNDVYEQKARDEGWTDPEAIKYWAAKYRAADEKKKAKTAQPELAGLSMIAAANTVAGNVKPLVAERQQSALANPALFGGGISDSAIKARLTAQKNALDEARRNRLKQQGNAVYMGSKDIQIRRPFKNEGEFEGGQNRIPQKVQTDNIVDKNQLMAWLADENQFNAIKDRMQKSGIQVETYDDVAKLWKSVIDQASATYSLTGKKVTPWALLELRGKQMVGGKPAARTTTQTSFEDMDPAQARMIFEKAAADYLGRSPTNEEIDDFTAKAQMIAKEHPQVTKTTTQYDFAGNPVSSTSHSTGGADAAAARAQVEAKDMAMQDEEYGAVQAAGFYFPLLFSDAIRAPV